MSPAWRPAALVAQREITTRTVPDRATGERQLHAGTLDALENGSPESVQVVVRRSLSEYLRSAFTALAATGARHAGQPSQG